MDSRDLLLAVREAQRLPSNYALARALGLPDKSVQRWHTARNAPDDATAARLAQLAGLDPDAVVAAMQAQRCANPEDRERWSRIARRLEAAPALAVLALAALLWAPEPAAADSAISPSVYYVNLLALLLAAQHVGTVRRRLSPRPGGRVNLSPSR